MNNTRGARDDLKTINELLDKRGGYSAENEGKTIEIEIRILTEEKNFRLAREKIVTSNSLPTKTKHKLSRLLAKAISFSPNGVDDSTIQWAKKILAN